MNVFNLDELKFTPPGEHEVGEQHVLAPGQEHLGGGASTPICQAPPWVTSGNISRPVVASRAATAPQPSPALPRSTSPVPTAAAAASPSTGNKYQRTSRTHTPPDPHA